MEIKLNIINKIDIKEIKEKIKWIDLDFSSIHSLQGNKELLEKTFQETKKEMIHG
jgi:hypothetical protein